MNKNTECISRTVNENNDIQIQIYECFSGAVKAIVKGMFKEDGETFTYYEQNSIRHVLMFYKEELAGYAEVKLQHFSEALIDSMYVKNEFRQKGIFNEFLNKGKSLLGVKTISFLSKNDNPGSQYLAEKYKEELVNADLLMVKEVSRHGQNKVSLVEADSAEFDSYFDENFVCGNQYRMDDRFSVKNSECNMNFFVLNENGTRVGTLNYDGGREEAELSFFCIGKDYRRKGYGEASLAAILDYAFERGIKKFYLEVEAANRPAMSLYNKFGFEVVRGLYEYKFT